jgi:hypothetical protein
MTSVMLYTPKILGVAVCMLLTLQGCSSRFTASPAGVPDAIFTVQAENQRTVVRVLTQAATCPSIAWDGNAEQAMAVRASAGTLPARGDSGQQDNKAAVFDVLTCEATWPQGAARAQVAGQHVPAPRAEIKRIVIVADTGCRMKASENAFQDCNDAKKWPFAQIAQSAAAKNPDLVIHIGDMHYRESPCPPGNAGCTGSPWGYGYDTWRADFFKPGQALLAAAPWVFVRGNHESCFRAGQGWFRFMDAQPWSTARSCNDPAQDADADYSEPYALPIAKDTQLVVFDSSRTSGKAFANTDHAFGKYSAQMRAVNQLTQQKPHSFFLSHHPLLAYAPTDDPQKIKLGGNAGLQSVLGALNPQRLFPDGVSVAMHGHVHLFEAISFKSAHPASLVMGNSGSANEGFAPAQLAANAQPYPGAVVADYAAQSEYGFATLDRQGAGGHSDWVLTEYNVAGQAKIRCNIRNGKSSCQAVSP